MKREHKKNLIKKFSKHSKDTGSSQVQVAIMSWRIEQLTEHLKTHPKDLHSKRGLVMLVGKRRKLLNYLKLNDKERYESLLPQLNLRK